MNDQTDAHFMRMAIDLATANVVSGAGGPFGAVIVKDGAIVATGVNQVTATNDPTAHAEVTAIRAAAQALGHFELTGCTIYSSCEPCPMCLGAIYWSRVDALYFGSTAQDAAAAGSTTSSSTTKSTGHSAIAASRRPASCARTPPRASKPGMPSPVESPTDQHPRL